MKGKKFSILLTSASALGALLGVIFVGIQADTATSGETERMLWVGAFFLMMFVFGFIALQLAMVLHRTYRVKRNPLWPVAFLVACALMFGIGAGGQYLFMYSKEDVVVPAEVDMVLLLDASGSMKTYGYIQPRNDAACQFVDSLNEDCRLQTVSFAARVLDSSKLMVMNDSNKNQMKQMISAIDAIGDTDFNDPLRKAKDTLDNEGRAKCNKAVVLLTDGDASLSSGIVSEYQQSDIKVFSIRISKSTTLSPKAQKLADFAVSTGGTDTQLIPNPDGSINTSAMLKAFENAFKASSETRVNMREGHIIYSENGVTTWQFLVRAIVMVLCTMLIGFGYFGKFGLGTILSGGIMGLAAAALIGVLEATAFWPCVIIMAPLTGTAFVLLDLRGEDRINV